MCLGRGLGRNTFSTFGKNAKPSSVLQYGEVGTARVRRSNERKKAKLKMSVMYIPFFAAWLHFQIKKEKYVGV